jgi:hypothetical protein
MAISDVTLWIYIDHTKYLISNSVLKAYNTFASIFIVYKQFKMYPPSVREEVTLYQPFIMAFILQHMV